ncbi:MAG: HEAT repeat domain-containing protein [Cyanobium sp.]
MNPSQLGAVAAILILALWLVGRRKPRPFLRSADTSAVAALNRSQIERVLSRPSLSPSPRGASSGPSPRPSVPYPDAQAAAALEAHPIPARGDRRSRQLLLRRLQAASGASLVERIAALRFARRWRHPSTLPLLRRGLRDVHPAVVLEAARALEAYRGRSAAPTPPASSRSPRSPRTVARTR